KNRSRPSAPARATLLTAKPRVEGYPSYAICGTCSRSSRPATSLPALCPCISALGRRMMRWASTDSARVLMSSGTTKLGPGIAARPAHQPRDVLAQLGLDEDFADRVLRRPKLVGRDDRLQLLHRGLDLVLIEQVRFFLLCEIAELDLHQETVELGLRQRERA